MIAMKRLITILLASVAFTTLSAQKYDYSMERIGWINPWTTSSNSSGMVLNESFLQNISSYTEGEVSGYISSGDLKNIYDPKSRYGGNFYISSYMKLGKGYLRGDFNYDYSIARESRWRGWTDPYSTPFMLADTIPGNLSHEQYRMGAALAYPASDLISLGIGLKYNVGIMAKHLDLRNKNTVMEFEVTPSMMISWDKFKLGLDLGYLRNTEKVEYKQEDASEEKYLFYLYGLWLYHSTGFSSAETSRENITSGYNASLTADLSVSGARIFNDFTAGYTTAMQGETGYNGLIHGQTNRLSFNNQLTILCGYRHKIGAKVHFYTMVGNKFLQRQELDPQSNIRVWVTYGGPINYYYRSFASEEISYTYRMAKSNTDIKWEATAGIKGIAVSHKYKETPLTFNQSLNTMEAYLKYAHYIPFRNSRLDIAPEVAYSFSDGIMNNTEEGQNQWQFEKELMEEYNFWHAPKIKGGLEVKYTFKAISVKGKYHGEFATGGAVKGDMRHYGVVSFGFAF